MNAMAQDLAFIRALAGEAEASSRWRLLRRGGRVLLMMRDTAAGVRAGVRLYRPQRRAARLLCQALGCCPGLRRFLPSLESGIAADSPLGRSLQGGGMEVAALLLGNPRQEERRAVALAEGGQARVIKLGVGRQAVEAIGREADFLEHHRDGRPEIPELRSRSQGDGWASFAIDFLPPAAQPAGLAEVVAILDGWWCGAPLAFRELPGWRRVKEAGAVLPPETLEVLADLELQPARVHGDLAPWNVLRDGRGQPVLIDWENGRRADVPCWDLVHYLFQQLVLVERVPAGGLRERILRDLESPAVAGLLRRSGWSGAENLLLLSYLAGMAMEPEVVKEILNAWSGKDVG